MVFLLMRLVSPLLRHAIYPALHHSGWLRRLDLPGGFAVVSYHGLLTADHSSPDLFLDGNLLRPEAFRKQLRFMKSRYRVIHPEEFRDSILSGKGLPPRAVLLTCDDGLLNTLTDMLPILRSEGVGCLFFVTAASCSENPGMLWYEELYHLMRNQPLERHLHPAPEESNDAAAAGDIHAAWWSVLMDASRLDAKRRGEWLNRVRAQRPAVKLDSEKRWRLLHVSELKQLSDAGMTIGAHSKSHPVLSQCSDDELREEICGSKSKLEKALGREIWAFAYPFGNPATVGDREVRAATEAGFNCALLNVEHWYASPPTLLTQPRIHVSLRTTLPELAAHLSGLHARLQHAAGR